MNPKISVIIPVYNQQRYLAETISSVLEQTFYDFELIIIDDGSKDNSINIIKYYSGKDNRIITIFQDNAGKPESINRAAIVARGEYLAFIDHDDIMLPDRLEKQIIFHSNNLEVDASSCHCYYINENGKPMGVQRFPGNKTVEECKSSVINNKIIMCAFTGLIVRKQNFISSGGLRSNFWPTDDLEFFNRFVEKGNILVINQEILMKYRAHNSSTTIASAWHVYVEKTDYTKDCILLRRAGKQEISYEEFIERNKKKTYLKKINRRRIFYAMILQKEAGFAIYSKEYTAFLWKITAATILYPSFIIATIRKRL
ncbi:glycosyltransferase family 2 protein [Hymenobacter norwichensis]|uniref:glycosyltransferase family 2 protein n=1 Tax=Hymenobacter norwichensis TaxID=223903 RepID=UPI0003B41FA2|nr:glycosyltransferase family 2 protein [Hymenobacter norwichensis]